MVDANRVLYTNPQRREKGKGSLDLREMGSSGKNRRRVVLEPRDQLTRAKRHLLKHAAAARGGGGRYLCRVVFSSPQRWWAKRAKTKRHDRGSIAKKCL